jgi:hypothetical protein
MLRPRETLTHHQQRAKVTPKFESTFEIADQTQAASDPNDILRIYCQGVIRALIEEQKENQNHGESLGILPAVNRQAGIIHL